MLSSSSPFSLAVLFLGRLPVKPKSASSLLFSSLSLRFSFSFFSFAQH
jgi:hypothetical protein